MKKPVLLIIALAIGGLVITSVVSIPATESIKNIPEKNIFRAVKRENQYFEICPDPMQLVSSHKIDYVPNEMIPRTAAFAGTDVPVLVSADDIDIENPCLLDNGGSTVIAIAEAHEDILSSTPILRYSNDGGITWLPEDTFLSWELEDYIEEKPAIDFAGDNGAFGSMIPVDPFTLLTLDIADITNHETGDGWVLQGWTTDDEIDSLDVAGVNSEYSPDTNALGLVVRTGDDSTGPTNIVYLGWRQGEDTLRGLWTGSGDDLLEWENVCCDIDLATGIFYYSYESYYYEDYADGIQLEWCQMDGTGDWWEVNEWYWTGGVIEGATNPDVKADGGNVYCAYELDGSIMCIYSNDNAETFNTVVITEDGKFPAITAVGETAVCSYNRDGNLYISVSEDGGASWEEKTQNNDVSSSVVEQPNCQHVSGNYVAWTDNRNAPPTGVYLDYTSDAPFSPSTPEGPTSGKTGQALAYSTSAVDPNGDDVSYGWDWDGDSVVDEWTTFNPSGAPVTTSHTWDADYTGEIKVKAKDTNDDESLWSNPLSVSIPKNKAVSYPLLQKSLEIFPNAFPLLKYILGL